MSLALLENEAQPALAVLYSAEILSWPALYSVLERLCAIAPALNAKVMATAMALMLRVFIRIPLCGEIQVMHWLYLPNGNYLRPECCLKQGTFAGFDNSSLWP